MNPIQCHYLDEPMLLFGDGGLHVSPKSGIARYGPRSYSPTKRHPSTVRVGFIGTAETNDKSRTWLEANAHGVPGDARHPEFPGYQPDRGFLSKLEFDDIWVEQITQSELDDLLKIRSQRDRFDEASSLLENKLRVLSRCDQPPQYVVVGLPDTLTRRSRVADYHDRELGMVHRDLRRVFKSNAMKYQIPTQLFRQPTMEGRDDDHPSKIAWNFFTGLYFKAGGIPWSPVGLEPGTCYVGVSFFKALGTTRNTIQTSLVQAFNEQGEGLVLRGPDFEWDAVANRNKSPHLTDEQAHGLLQTVLDRYREEMKQSPRRVVIHKSSEFWPGERDGFRAALHHNVDRFDLLAMYPQSEVRLITESKYPPLRGTQFSLGDLDFLYTSGFIAELQEFHSLHVPSPLRISDHVGQDTPREALLREVLILTKANWNSAHFGGLLPITLRFSKLVGEVLREIPSDRQPLPQFKYYM